jgi:hypothetical protein
MSTTCTAIVRPLTERKARFCGRSANHRNGQGAPRCALHRKGGLFPLVLALLLIACGVAPAPEPRDYGEVCCTCWESWTGGCTAMRLSKVKPFSCEARAARPPLCESEIAELLDAGVTPDAGLPSLDP